MTNQKKRALISVYDKSGIVDFARELSALDYEIISTGGTLKLLADNDIAVTAVDSITGFPECLDGRVKTLHPAVHAGILAKRDDEAHMATLVEQELAPIDLVVINLYPFAETIAKPEHTLADAIENIDIGGPTMLRSAAKNHQFVLGVVDPSDYDAVLEQLKNKAVDDKMRQLLALKIFEHTAHYDALISTYLRRKFNAEVFPKKLTLALDYQDELRYGENPHQRAVYYKYALSEQNFEFEQLHGKQLSFNNLSDAKAALEIIAEFSEPTCAAIKHANPCGIGSADDLFTAYQKAYEADNMSIFGGILAFNRPITVEIAEEIAKIFIELVIAPDYQPEALEILSRKKNIRLIKTPKSLALAYDYKSIFDGFLIQSADNQLFEELKVMTGETLSNELKSEIEFGLKAVKHLKSNAIVVVKEKQTIGLGPGQVSRIWAAEKALSQAGEKAKGAVLVSDAFIPFNDVIDLAAEYGIQVIVQPAGSKNDENAVKGAKEKGITMVFTGTRHFKH